MQDHKLLNPVLLRHRSQWLDVLQTMPIEDHKTKHKTKNTEKDKKTTKYYCYWVMHKK